MRTWTVVILIVFAAALALRLGFILETCDVPSFRSFVPGLDLDLHWRAADHVLDGRELSFELSSLSAPLFAYVLAAWKWVAGDSIVAIRVAAAVLGAVRILMLAALCRRLRLGIAGTVAATSSLALLPSVIYFDTMPSKVGIELTVLMALLLVLTMRRGSAILRGALVGVLLALSLASQLNTCLYIVPVATYLNWRAAAVAIASVLLAVVILVARDPGTAGRPAWFLPRAGIDLAVGFHDDAGVTYRLYRDILGNPYGHAFTARVAIENDRGAPVSQVEADRTYQDRALAWIATHPKRALALAADRALGFVANTEPAGDHSLYRLRRHSRVARIALGFGCVFALAAIGIVACWRERQRRLLLLLLGLVVVQLVVVCATNLNWRYRLPAVVPLALLAGVGVDHVIRVWRARTRYRLLAPLVAMTIAAILSFACDGAADHRRDLALAREHELTAKHAERVAATLPATTGVARAMHLHELARYTEAYEALAANESALADHPVAARAYLEYLISLGERDRARALLARWPAETRDAVLTERKTPYDAGLRRLAQQQ